MIASKKLPSVNDLAEAILTMNPGISRARAMGYATGVILATLIGDAEIAWTTMIDAYHDTGKEVVWPTS